MSYTPSMMIVQDKLVSVDLLREEFVCNLSACKGACCWEGDFGAPLKQDELLTLQQIYPDVSPYLSPAGRAAIEAQGVYVRTDDDGDIDYSTPLIEGGPCAYLTYDDKGIGQCGIERAWLDGAVEYRKPISCQLYPIRVVDNAQLGFSALNYDRWDICSAACANGKKLGVPVYKFLQDAITRAYGEAFYEELDDIAADFKED